MTDREQEARRHDEENRAEFAIRRDERALQAQERELTRELSEFDQAEAKAKHDIEAELRAEHAGHEPERPPAWESEPPARTGHGS